MKRKILNNSKGVYEFITSIINKIKESFNKKKEKRRNKRIESLREISKTIEKMMDELPHLPESEDDIKKRFAYHLYLFQTGSISESGFSHERFEGESRIGILNISGDTYRLTNDGIKYIENLCNLYMLSSGRFLSGGPKWFSIFYFMAFIKNFTYFSNIFLKSDCFIFSDLYK